MHVDTSVIVAVCASGAAVVGWFRATAWKFNCITEQESSEMLADDLRIAEAKIAHFNDIEAARQAQRVAASQRAAVVNHERAEARRKAAAEMTAEAIKTLELRPRDEVVAPVRARRAKESGAVATAAQAG